MEKKLFNKRVAILVTDGFEESEFTVPLKALQDAQAIVEVVSINPDAVKAWNHTEWGNEYPVDVTIDKARAEEYDALVLPGGVMSPDKLRVNGKVVEFVSDFVQKAKPIAAICHGPWTLIETGLLEGRTLTSYPSIKTDLVNAGVNWVDKAVVVDNGLVTSRNPDDLPVFCEKMIEEIAEGIHNRRKQLV